MTADRTRIAGVPTALTAALWLSLAAGPARAHDTWLLPAAAQAKPGMSLALAMTSGMAFPHEESPTSPTASRAAACASPAASWPSARRGRARRPWR